MLFNSDKYLLTWYVFVVAISSLKRQTIRQPGFVVSALRTTLVAAYCRNDAEVRSKEAAVYRGNNGGAAGSRKLLCTL